MPTQLDGRRRSRGRGPQAMVVGGCVGLPVVLATLLVCVYMVNNRPVRYVVPTHALPHPNAYDDFVRAGVLVSQVKHVSPISQAKPDFSFASFEAAAIDARPALAILRRGLAREYLNPPVRSVAASAVMPQYAAFRNLARTESGVAFYFEMDDKPAAATEARLDALEMGVMMPRGGHMIAGLVGVACEAIAVSAMERPLTKLSAAELAHVAERLERIESRRVPFADVLQEEGYTQTSLDVEMLNDPKGYRNLDTLRDLLAEDDPSAPTPGTRKPLTIQQDLEGLKFIVADKAAIVRDNQAYSDALVAEARGPYSGASTVLVPNNLLAQMRGGIFMQARAKFAAMDAVQAVLRTEVALLRYKRAHGRFPATLDALSPEYLRPERMTDPFTQAPLRYRPTGSSFLLYSIGTDLKDGGGTPCRSPVNGPGDIVAGRMWPNRRTFKK